MANFLGKWKLFESDENFEDYLKEMGVCYAHRKIGAKLITYEELEKMNEDTWVMSFSASFKRMRSEFKFGKEFQEKTMDGREILAVFREEDGVLVKDERDVKERAPNTRITRHKIDDQTMKITYEANGVKAVQLYGRNHVKQPK